ncbi:MAG: hypothetical protein JW894_00045, partial [Bacteroidales bacterium]|nr:hypothetical protein [Bacteroidales bacterium]
MKAFLSSVALILICGNIIAQDIQSVTVYYTAYGVSKSESLSAGTTRSISRDQGTPINIRIYKSTSAPSSSTFTVACFPSGVAYERTTTNTSEYFTNVGDALTNDIWCSVNIVLGTVRIQPVNIPTSYPDLSPINRSVDGYFSPSGRVFYVDQTVDLECDIWNNGSASSGSNRVGFYIGTTASDYSDFIDYNSTGTLPVGYSEHETDNYTFSSSDLGTRYINFWADYQDVIEEGTAEGNNKQSWGPFTVAPAPLGINVSQPSADITVVQGQLVNIAWTGSGTEAIMVSLRRDNDNIWENGTGETWIALSQPISGSFSWNTADVPPGTYYIAGAIFNSSTSSYDYAAGRVTVSPLCTITGKAVSDLNVYDRIGGATVTIDGNSQLQAITDSYGNYTINNVPAGSHNFTISHDAYWWEGNNSTSYTRTVNVTGDQEVNFSGHCIAYPEVTYDIPSTFTPGTPFDITVTLKNTNYAISGVKAYLDVSFPDFTSSTSAVTVIDQSGFDANPQLYQPGTSICRVNTTTGEMDCNFPAEWLLVSATRSSTIHFNSEWTYTLRITPPEIASFRIHIKGSIGDQRWPASGVAGQQGYYEELWTLVKNQVVTNPIISLFGDPVGSENITFFGQTYKLFYFQYDGEITFPLPFYNTEDTEPLVANLINDEDLASLIYNYHSFTNNFGYIEYPYVNELEQIYDYYHFNDWFVYLPGSLILAASPLNKRAIDRQRIGAISYGIAEGIGKSYILGPQNIFLDGLIPVIEQFSLDGISEDEIKALLLAESAYGGDLPLLQGLLVLSDISSNTIETIANSINYVDYLKGLSDLEPILTNAETFIKAGNISAWHTQMGLFQDGVVNSFNGLAFNLALDYAKGLIGLPDLQEEVKVYSWLHDAHYEAIAAIAKDLLEIASEIDLISNGSQYKPRELGQLYYEFTTKYSYVMRSLLCELAVVQLSRISYIRGNFPSLLTWWLVGTNVSVIDEQIEFVNDNREAYEQSESDYADYVSEFLVFFQSYEALLSRLKEEETNSLLKVIGNIEDQEVGLGTSELISLNFENNYSTGLIINSISFSSEYDEISLNYSSDPILLSANNNIVYNFNVLVEENWFTNHMDDNFINKDNIFYKVPIALNIAWEVNNKQYTNKFIINVTITSEGRITQMYPDKGIVRPGEIITISVDFEGLPASNYGLAHNLMKPDGSIGTIEIALNPVNNKFSFTEQIPTGPYGAWGMRAFISEIGGNIMVPYCYVRNSLFVVPAIEGDISTLNYGNIYLIYPEADVEVALDAKALLNITDDRFIKVEDFSTNDLLSFANNNDVLLIGGHIANPLTALLTTTDLTKEGDAVIRLFNNAFNQNNAIVIAGWNIRDTQTAMMGFLDEYNDVLNDNTPPSVNNYEVIELQPSGNLLLTYEYVDPDGDPESGTLIKWFKNDIHQSALDGQMTVSSDLTEVGDTWYVTVCPSDGLLFGDEVASNTVTIDSQPAVSLVAFYPFNENAEDNSVYDNDGTIYGAVMTSDRFGNSNSALYFDGVDDYVDCGNDNSINPSEAITIACWINSSDLSLGRLVSKWGLDSGYDLDLYNNDVRFAMNQINVVNYNISEFINTWLFIAVVWDGTNVNFYINGELVSTGLQTSSITASPNNLFIGEMPNFADSYFNGVIDDIRIYDGALSQSDILDFYNEGGWPDAIVPKVITKLSERTINAAVGGGEITNSGSMPVTARGVCWSTNPYPTVDLTTKTTDGSGIGTFVSNITGLLPGTTYYIRAYATNSIGTGYGEEFMFTTYMSDAVSDIDGNLYNKVTIGSQTWLAENLKTTRLNDGSNLQLESDNDDWYILNSPGYCWYNNDIGNKEIYGGLYNWNAVNTGKLCPVGWHVPSNSEWNVLENSIGGISVAGMKLKESGTSHWPSPNNGTDEYGFTALPGGYRHGTLSFSAINEAGVWSTSSLVTTGGRTVPWYVVIYDHADYTEHGSTSVTDGTKDGYSIRCVKDETQSETIGNTEIYSSVSTQNYRRAIPVTFTEAGTIQSLSIYHNGGTG